MTHFMYVAVMVNYQKADRLKLKSKGKSPAGATAGL
nr:MAG TPA: hypothetical protein [Caudoviricetes sp.]